MIRIKICGLRREEDVMGVNRFDINDAGFVFAKSPRQVSEERAAELGRSFGRISMRWEFLSMSGRKRLSLS